MKNSAILSLLSLSGMRMGSRLCELSVIVTPLHAQGQALRIDFSCHSCECRSLRMR